MPGLQFGVNWDCHVCHPHDRVISHPGILPTQLRQNICTEETNVVIPIQPDTDTQLGFKS